MKPEGSCCTSTSTLPEALAHRKFKRPPKPDRAQATLRSAEAVSITAGTGQTVFRRGGFNPAPPRAPAPEAVAAGPAPGE